MFTYILPSCPSLHFKDSCGRPWNYCPPTLLSLSLSLSSSYLGASWSGSHSLILLLTTIAYRSCFAPFDSTFRNHIDNHNLQNPTRYDILSLEEKIANVTKSSRADCQVCADCCAQAIAGQEQCSQQDAPKIALRSVPTVPALPLCD